MIETTHQNHYRFGYNGEYWNDRTDKNDQWFFDLGKCSQVLPLYAESKRTARLLWEKNIDIPKILLMSGGVDSEFCATTFLDEGLKFDTVIGRWNNSNDYDIQRAVTFCEDHNIKFKIYDLDLFTFFESKEAEYYSKLTQVNNPYMLTHMWLMNRVEGFPILGNGDPDVYVNDQNSIVVSFKEQVATWHKFLIRQNKLGCGGFFEYTPELMLAYINEILEIDAIRNKTVKKFSDIKPKFINNLLGLKIRKKYSGFERFHLANIDFVSNIRNKMEEGLYNKSSKDETFLLKNSIEVDIFFLQKYLQRS